jgi:hypothetical protein
MNAVFGQLLYSIKVFAWCQLTISGPRAAMKISNTSAGRSAAFGVDSALPFL